MISICSLDTSLINIIAAEWAPLMCGKRAVVLILYFTFWVTAGVAAEPLKVIVFPLENRINTESLSWLGEGVAISLAEQMRSSGITIVDRHSRAELVENLDLPPGAPLSRASMIRVAQQASIDVAVMGSITGTGKNLRITTKILKIKPMKLGGDIVANGSLAVLPQMENELAWLILSNGGLSQMPSRQEFQKRTRMIPNTAYAYYIHSFNADNENDQLKLLLKAVNTYKDFPAAQFLLGKYYYQKGEYKNAIPHLTEARKNEDTYLQNEFLLGTSCLQQNIIGDAIQSFSHLLSFRRLPEALNNIGLAYLRKGDYALAVQNFLEARKISPGDPNISLNLAILRYLQDNDAAACALLEETAAAYPKNGMLQFVLGFMLDKKNESQKAEAAMGKARSLGINIDEFRTENPQNWVRVLVDWPGP
jgi:Flp pilus assembly protein TadD/TolB-like protein